MNHPIDQAIGVFRECEALNLSSADQRLIKMQIEALEGIRKSLSDFGSMGYQIQRFEKLISDPWMENRDVFDRTYSAWEDFRYSYSRGIGGMTVNERL
jgi:predicted KAP-like P-loop ATPase